ncbi:MAG: hypothetical protein QXL67_03695 [Candidatus Bathyarchaeia archaeon]
MGKYRVSVRRSFGTMEVEAETPDELLEALHKMPDILSEVDEILAKKELMTPSISLKGLIYRSEEGPLLTVPKDRLSAREAIGMLLYAAYPDGIKSRDLGRLLNISGWFTPGYPSRLSELKRSGLVISSGGSYKLTLNGVRWVEGEVVPKARAGEKYEE